MHRRVPIHTTQVLGNSKCHTEMIMFTQTFDIENLNLLVNDKIGGSSFICVEEVFFEGGMIHELLSHNLRFPTFFYQSRDFQL